MFTHSQNVSEIPSISFLHKTQTASRPDTEPSPSSPHGSPVGSPTRIPFTRDTALNPSWRPSMCCRTWSRPSRIWWLLRWLAARQHSPPHAKGAVLFASYANEKDTAASPKTESYPTLDSTFSCLQPEILRLYEFME